MRPLNTNMKENLKESNDKTIKRQQTEELEKSIWEKPLPDSDSDD